MMNYNKDNFDQKVEMIVPSGFTRLIKGENVFVKEYIDKIERIDIPMRDYSPHGIYLGGVIVSIAFLCVENPLKELFEKYNVKVSLRDSTISYSFIKAEGIDYALFDTEINDSESFNIVAGEIRKIIDNNVQSFFQGFKNLESVANLLADLKPQEVVPYIQGAQLFVKSILILKLANHHRYQEKKTEFREVLAQQAEKKEVYQQQLEIFDDLFSIKK